MKYALRGLGLALGLAVVVVGQGGTAAGRPGCLVSNERTGVAALSLQAAVDLAADGDTLVVKGRCVGSTTMTRGVVTLKGHGHAILDGDHQGPVIQFGAFLAVRNLTITNGLGDLQGFPPVGGGITSSGGGVLSLDHSAVIGNAGIGISMLEGGTSVTLTHSTVADNAGVGIAVVHTTGFVTLTASKVRGNTGGGISLEDTALRATDSSISGNSTTGIYGVDGSAVLTNSTVSRNSASQQGGGLYLTEPFSLTLAGSSRVTHNTAGVAGGGLFGGGLDVVPDGIRLTGADRIKHNTPDNCYPPIGPLAACPER